ncbi:MAG TPA: archease [Streptosporangiaceae bacterium]
MARCGHRTVPHTADLRIEAWGGSREECLAQAAQALVASFAEFRGAPAARSVTVRLPAAPPADLLTLLLDEIVYLVDAGDEVPVTITVRPAADGGADADLGLASLASAEIVGAAPKAISLHELRCEADAAGQWSASVTVDV